MILAAGTAGPHDIVNRFFFQIFRRPLPTGSPDRSGGLLSSTRRRSSGALNPKRRVAITSGGQSYPRRKQSRWKTSDRSLCFSISSGIRRRVRPPISVLRRPLSPVRIVDRELAGARFAPDRRVDDFDVARLFGNSPRSRGMRRVRLDEDESSSARFSIARQRSAQPGANVHDGVARSAREESACVMRAHPWMNSPRGRRSR